MRRCWHYYPKHRPSFFDILQDFEADMSDKFREVSFYFNQDVGETTSLSDENEFDTADNSEYDRLNKPSNDSAPGCSNRSSPSTPKCLDRSDHRTNNSQDSVPGTSRQAEIADSKKPLSASASQGTDRLLAASDSDDIELSDITCSGGLSPHDKWNGGNVSSDVLTGGDTEADAAHRKGMLTNGHIPFNFMTTARC